MLRDVLFTIMQLLPTLTLAQASLDWHASSLTQAVFYTAIFSILGLVLAVIGYKVFDLCTPGNLHEEIIKNRNVAAAILGGAIIIGVCIVVAAAIVG